jgi:hypothetical protein
MISAERFWAFLLSPLSGRCQVADYWGNALTRGVLSEFLLTRRDTFVHARSVTARTTSVKVPPTSTLMRARRFGFPFPDVHRTRRPAPLLTYRKIDDAAPAHDPEKWEPVSRLREA